MSSDWNFYSLKKNINSQVPHQNVNDDSYSILSTRALESLPLRRKLHLSGLWEFWFSLKIVHPMSHRD